MGTENTTGGIPGGSYKTWDEARAATRYPVTSKSVTVGLTLVRERRSDGHVKELKSTLDAGNCWKHLTHPDSYVRVADRPAGWRTATTAAEARAMLAAVAGGYNYVALPASEIVTRSARRAASGDEEIYSVELTRIRAEHIRRYATVDRVEAAARDGFVYVMAHTIYSPGIVKVGHSRDPYRRTAQANTNSAEGKHRIIYMRFFKDRALAESLVHSILWDSRVQGEHFRVSVGEAIRVIAGVDQ